MIDPRQTLAQLLMGQQPGAGPLTFEQLMAQEKGNRDRAALRMNAQDGGPPSTAFNPNAAPSLPQTAPVPTPRPDVPAQAPVTLPDTAPIPAAKPAVNPLQAAVDAAPVLKEQGPTPVQVPLPTETIKGAFDNIGDARRGAVGKVKKSRKNQYRLG